MAISDNSSKLLRLHYTSDLPPDTKLEDMDLLAGFDLKKLPNVEEAGENCVRKIQEYMIHDVSSKEVAILPKDKLQKLAVGVCVYQNIRIRVCIFTNSSFLFNNI